MRVHFQGLVRAVSLGLVCGAGAVQANSSAEAGSVIYQDACAACHGADARGRGPNAAMLGTPVPDLTGLAARNAGTFDAVRVIHTIDGRAGLAAHGGPMPLFGGLLTGPAVVIDDASGAPVSTTEPILAIVRWLETRQEGTQ